jgi:hypothetical protein
MLPLMGLLMVAVLHWPAIAWPLPRWVASLPSFTLATASMTEGYFVVAVKGTT